MEVLPYFSVILMMLNPTHANRNGANPIHPNYIGVNPRNADRNGVKPMHANHNGVKPMNADRNGVEPIHANYIGVNPRNADRNGVKPMHANHNGVKPMNADRNGMKPMHANHNRVNTMHADRNGVNPMHADRSEMSPHEDDVTIWCKHLRWREPPGPITALASFPGSGNTWLRYLLQQATGILTGSVYCHRNLERPGFPTQCIENGSVIVIKTHGPPPLLDKQPGIQMAILLIRHPRDAIVTIYNGLKKNGNYKTGSSTPKKGIVELTSRKDDSNNVTEEWKGFVDKTIRNWEKFHDLWLSGFFRPLHIVYYEELVRDIRRTLRGILDFLNVQVSEYDLDCALRNSEKVYRSLQNLINIKPFTPNMNEKIETARRKVMEAVKRLSKIHKTREKLVERVMLHMKPNKMSNKFVVHNRHFATSRFNTANSRQLVKYNNVSCIFK